ncbi:MAG: hypothetical protein IPI30_13035 [Saprospiraceae bacterium]|nr:hypothetical protein [Candidatus Vicinibacter affinis]
MNQISYFWLPEKWRQVASIRPLRDIKHMIRFKLLFLIISLHCSCIKHKKLYDEIHLSTHTDSSYIQLFVSRDSIIILQLERGECDGYGACKYGPKFYAQTSKTNNTFDIIDEEVQRLLSDTFHLEEIMITHATTSSIKFLSQDSLIKNFRFYGSEKNSRDIEEVKKQLLNIISQTNRSNINTTERLIDISDLTDIDSISINKLKPVEIDGYNGKRINYIKDYELKMISQKEQIESFINIIQMQKIIDRTTRKGFGKLIPKYEINFYRNRLICFQLETDLVIMPYSWLQVLKVDSLLISNFN